MQLKDKVAIVTGGGGAIGRAISLGLAREGARVAICDLFLERAEETVAQLRGQGALGLALPLEGLALQADVGKKDDVTRMVEETVRHFGRIDILINNAGICPSTLVVDMDEEEWDRVLNTNLKGVFICSQAVARHMIAQRGGKILSVTSDRGVNGMYRGAHYAASKGGINGFTRSLGRELATYGINVNAIAPGITDTPMTRAILTPEELEARAQAQVDKRIGQPEDVVEAVIFLCSEASRAMYGQIVYMRTP